MPTPWVVEGAAGHPHVLVGCSRWTQRGQSRLRRLPWAWPPRPEAEAAERPRPRRTPQAALLAAPALAVAAAAAAAAAAAVAVVVVVVALGHSAPCWACTLTQHSSVQRSLMTHCWNSALWPTGALAQ